MARMNETLAKGAEDLNTLAADLLEAYSKVLAGGSDGADSLHLMKLLLRAITTCSAISGLMRGIADTAVIEEE